MLLERADLREEDGVGGSGQQSGAVLPAGLDGTCAYRSCSSSNWNRCCASRGCYVAGKVAQGWEDDGFVGFGWPSGSCGLQSPMGGNGGRDAYLQESSLVAACLLTHPSENTTWNPVIPSTHDRSSTMNTHT